MKLNKVKLELIYKWFLLNNKTISTMESCTGGYISNVITNISGSSNIFNYGYVTYSNQAKIDIGVNEVLINTYTVYSVEVANNMAYIASTRSNSDFGIGVTGELGKEGKITYISIYDKLNNKYYNKTVSLALNNRELEKLLVANLIIDLLFEIIELV